MKKFILNADDLGLSSELNKAIDLGAKSGILLSSTICSNGEAFDEAILEVIPSNKNLDVGIHLNIMEGKPLTRTFRKNSLLFNSRNEFRLNYQGLLLNSFDKYLLNEIENEFRLQIEKFLNVQNEVFHIDSHVHTHSIPNIFQIVKRLSKEYKIPYIRTQNEKFYFVNNWGKNLSEAFCINLVKNNLLNILSFINKQDKNLNTNDFLIGVLYTGNMDKFTILDGLKSIKKDNALIEALIHPKYSEEVENARTLAYEEFLITQNEDFLNDLKEIGVELTSYRNLTKEKNLTIKQN